MLAGYNTNGFAHHRLEDALEILAELGCQSVALTLDYHALNPYEAEFQDQFNRVRESLRRLKLRNVIETGARYLLDPRRKHQPTLLDADPAERRVRAEFLKRAVDIAQVLGSDAVSFWSGSVIHSSATASNACGFATANEPRFQDSTSARDSDAKPQALVAVREESADSEGLMARLVEGCRDIADYAAERGVRIGFEPEPGMLIDTMSRFAELHRRVARPNFGLTLDIGHLHCLGETPIADHIVRWQDWLWNIHIEDMRAGVHDHLPFGEGEIDFGPVFAALRQIGYAGGLHVELSRHSHDAVRTAKGALEFISFMRR